MIKFGTSGWRGIIADDFTFDNVKIVTQAIANYLINDDKEYKKDKAVIMGYDTRFLSDHTSGFCICFSSSVSLDFRLSGSKTLLNLFKSWSDIIQFLF